MSILINKDTKVITQGITGKTGQFHTRMCREYANGKNAFVANVAIRFEGIKDLSPAVLAEHGYPGMTPVPLGGTADVEFLILYELNADGLIQHIKGAVYIPAPAA